MSGPVRLALVGAGNMAREHARAFRRVPGVTLAGIHSRTREKAENLAREAGFERVASSVDELYRSTAANLVVVTVSMLEMLSVAMSVMRYPWTILLEKPAGVNLQEAQILADAAGNRRNVYVALNRRMYGATRAALQDVSSRNEQRYVRVADQQDQSAAAALGHPARVVSNWMFGNSIHLIDYFTIFCRGSAVSVDRLVPWHSAKPGLVLAKIRFDSGDLGLYEGVWDGPGPWAVAVQTPSRRWEMRPLEHAGYQNRGERILRDVPVEPCDTEFKAGFFRQAEQAAAAARGEPSELASVADSLQSMRLVASIFEERA